MKNIFLVLCVFLSISVFSQVPDRTDKVLLQNIKQFIPENYDILDLKVGRLNSDTLNDVVFILKSKNESKPHNSYEGEWSRPLFILFQQSDKSYILKSRIDSLVLCEGCGGMLDPYGGFEIKQHLILIDFNGGSRYRWTRHLEFSYDPTIDNFILTKDDEGGYDSLNLDTVYAVKPHTDIKKVKVTIDKFRLAWEK